MSAQQNDLLAAYRRLAGRFGLTAHAIKERDCVDAIQFAQSAMQAGQARLAARLLEQVVARAPKFAPAWRALGLAARDTQDMEHALRCLSEAKALDGHDPTTAFALAQVLFETGRPSRDAFTQARLLSPINPTLIRNSAAALSGDGDHDAAQTLLSDILVREPQWLDGHKTLAALRVAAGQRDDFDASFRVATKARPDSLSLRLAHVHLLSTARDWEGAKQVLKDALSKFGPQLGLELARLYVAAEAGGQDGDSPALFASVSNVQDVGLDICRVRHALRLGLPELARDIAQAHVRGPAARTFWPYLGLAWRLLGDTRSDWLEGSAQRAAQFDLGLSPSDLTELGICLSELHIQRAPFLEQSVQLGTQTSGQLFFRPTPIIQKVREAVLKSVDAYVGTLDAQDPDHPLLGTPRAAPYLFEGSWSVLLKAGGYHSTHTHPKGWISSALYIDVPDEANGGEAPKGWLSLGEGPPELNLDLGPTGQIKPKAGMLVLFPSTQWHRTVPFDQGQRLTIAFDIRVPTLEISPE